MQSADDVRAAKAAAASAGAPDMPIIAKIEKPQAVEQVDEILEVAEGLMIARGDLGIELPLETLPAVQKRLIRAAHRAVRPSSSRPRCSSPCGVAEAHPRGSHRRGACRR